MLLKQTSIRAKQRIQSSPKRKKSWGSYCCIPGCGKSTGNSKLFVVPNGKKKRNGLNTKKWSEEFFKILYEVRDPDNNNFKKQLENGRATICIDHFQPQDIYHTRYRTTIKYGKLPTFINKDAQSKRLLHFKCESPNNSTVTGANKTETQLQIVPYKRNKAGDNKWDSYPHPTFGKQSQYTSPNQGWFMKPTNEDYDGNLIGEINRPLFLQNNIIQNRNLFEKFVEEDKDTEIIVLPLNDPPIVPQDIDLEENKDILKIDLIDLIFKFDECCEKMSDVIKAHPNMDNSELMCFYKLLALEVNCLKEKLDNKPRENKLIKKTKKNDDLEIAKVECSFSRSSRAGQLPVPMVAEGLGPKFYSNDYEQENTASVFAKSDWNASYNSPTLSILPSRKLPNLLKRAKPLFVKTVTVGVPSLHGSEVVEKKPISKRNSSVHETINRETKAIRAAINTTPCLDEEDEITKDKLDDSSQNLRKKCTGKPRPLLQGESFREELLEKQKRGSKARFMKCDICERRCYSANSLLWHACVPKKTTKCPVCNKICLAKTIKKHMAWHDKVQLSKGKEEPSCPCGAKFKNKHQLNIHSTFPPTCILPNFACTVCHEAFFTVDDMKEHLLQKPCCCNGNNTCEYCDNIQDEESIKQHPHVKILNPYNCIHCEQTQSGPKELFKHVKEKHPTSFKYFCEICNKRYRTMSCLTGHKRNHCVGKPFLCEYCSKRFKSQVKCHKHIAKYHKQKL